MNEFINWKLFPDNVFGELVVWNWHYLYIKVIPVCVVEHQKEIEPAVSAQK